MGSQAYQAQPSLLESLESWELARLAERAVSGGGCKSIKLLWLSVKKWLVHRPWVAGGQLVPFAPGSWS